MPTFGSIEWGDLYRHSTSTPKIGQIYPLTEAGYITKITCVMRETQGTGGARVKAGIYSIQEGDISYVPVGIPVYPIAESEEVIVTRGTDFIAYDFVFSTPIYVTPNRFWIGIVADRQVTIRMQNVPITDPRHVSVRNDNAFYDNGFSDPFGEPKIDYYDIDLSIYATYMLTEPTPDPKPSVDLTLIGTLILVILILFVVFTQKGGDKS